MTRRNTQVVIFALMVGVMLLFAAGTAFADVHITDRSVTAQDGVSTLSLESIGDAAQLHGNGNPVTSPVDGSGDFYWFNQDVRAFDFTIDDTIDANGDIGMTDGTYAINNDGSGYGTPVPFSGEEMTFSDEGVYSLVANGTDLDNDPGTASATYQPAFGIDKTPPTSSSDATMAYTGGSATIDITANDAMSGVQDVRTSLDSGPWAYTYDGSAGPTDVDVTTLVPGPHTLLWQAFDNAGNMESHIVSFIVYTGTTVDINASAGANGQISPSGTVAADINADQAFTITPNAHYHVADVLVDGVSVGAVTNYTFVHVTEPHTISASFAIDTNNIVASSGAGGSISPAGTTAVPYGGSQTFTMQPLGGFRVANVVVDSVSVGAVSSYTFTNVTGPHTISVTYTGAFPTPFAPAITLHVKFLDAAHHNLQFYGNISPMAVDTRMAFISQRLNGKKWVNYGTIYRTIPAGTDSYSFLRSKSRHSKYRTKVSDSGTTTGWVTFTIK